MHVSDVAPARSPSRIGARFVDSYHGRFSSVLAKVAAAAAMRGASMPAAAYGSAGVTERGSSDTLKVCQVQSL
jgi:glutamate-1-semialdehyde aminotransferase